MIWTVVSNKGNSGSIDGTATKDQSTTEQAIDGRTAEAETVQKLTDSIDLPQYAWLNLKADSVDQDLTFKNPAQNFANLRVSILLADGTVLWVSDLIKPGETSDPVKLTKPLSAGNYNNAVLKYECFNDDEGQTPLNGAENKLTLKVH